MLVAVCATALSCFATQTTPQSAKPWTLEYSVVGGIAGLDQHLRLTDAGQLSIGNSAGRESYIVTHASSELMARMEAFLKVASQAQPLSPNPIPDQIYTSLRLTSAGSTYALELPTDVARHLSDTMSAVMHNALVGSWRQSGWKLCKPAAQLTAADVDVPIESLVFQKSGRFSVTWQGGGARAYLGSSVPHVEVPEYFGRYSIESYNSIRMSFESGIYTPRDFSGIGNFRINGDKLELRNIWLGTKQVKKKPDICELEFTRTS
jgi:hypothetical protein